MKAYKRVLNRWDLVYHSHLIAWFLDDSPMILRCKRLAILLSFVGVEGVGSFFFFFFSFSLRAFFIFQFGYGAFFWTQSLSQHSLFTPKLNLIFFYLFDSWGHLVGVGSQYSFREETVCPESLHTSFCLQSLELFMAWSFSSHCLDIRVKSNLYNLPLSICQHDSEKSTSGSVKPSPSSSATARIQNLRKSLLIYVLGLGWRLGLY